VSYLLQRMECYSGLAILATNMKTHIDAAFMRRLRYLIDIPFPDATARLLIWQKAFPTEMPCAALDFDALARLDIAGGNITVIAINAAFLAAADGVPLEMSHIARAARAEYRKLDREFRLNWLGVS
jgi:SpoVK/Ycf46/Vps4 family AAA+-type ATPase